MMKTFVGPHEGRELELMMAGTKPLSAFLEVVSQDVECFPEENFDALGPVRLAGPRMAARP